MSACEYFVGVDLGQVRDHTADCGGGADGYSADGAGSGDVGVCAGEAIVFASFGSGATRDIDADQDVQLSGSFYQPAERFPA
jgi:hypothetical protein